MKVLEDNAKDGLSRGDRQIHEEMVVFDESEQVVDQVVVKDLRLKYEVCIFFDRCGLHSRALS